MSRTIDRIIIGGIHHEEILPQKDTVRLELLQDEQCIKPADVRSRNQFLEAA